MKKITTLLIVLIATVLHAEPAKFLMLESEKMGYKIPSFKKALVLENSWDTKFYQSMSEVNGESVYMAVRVLEPKKELTESEFWEFTDQFSGASEVANEIKKKNDSVDVVSSEIIEFGNYKWLLNVYSYDGVVAGENRKVTYCAWITYTSGKLYHIYTMIASDAEQYVHDATDTIIANFKVTK